MQVASSKARNAMQVTGTVMTVALRRAALTLRRRRLPLKMERSIRIRRTVKRSKRIARVQRAYCPRKTDGLL